MIQSIFLGNCQLFFLHDGSFSIDGGAYFGIIPKVIWQNLVPTDERNRCRLHSCPLLVKTPQHCIMIDPGLGDKYTDKLIDMYDIKRAMPLQHSLKEINISSDDIDIVIATHLHFDHIGAATQYDEHKNIVPIFKNAIHYFQQGEWDAALHPDERSKGSYFKENYLPLQEAGLVKLIDGDTEIVPHIRVEVTGGHTLQHQAVFIESGGQTAIYWGDLTPDVNHLQIAYVAAVDLYPVQVMEKRREFYQRALAEKWLICLDHDAQNRAGFLELEGKRYGFRKAVK